MDAPEPIWPKKEMQPFAPSFSSGDMENLDAFVVPTDGAYLEGFQRAADMIVASAQSSDLNPDNLLFPVAYLYRHHLELMLKEVVRLGIRIGLLDECKDILGKHDLDKLWSKVKQLILKVWPDQANNDVEAAEQIINEFHKLDPRGEAFRYARTKDGGQHLAKAPIRVELSDLKLAVEAVSNFLDAAYAGIDACH